MALACYWKSKEHICCSRILFLAKTLNGKAKLPLIHIPTVIPKLYGYQTDHNFVIWQQEHWRCYFYRNFYGISFNMQVFCKNRRSSAKRSINRKFWTRFFFLFNIWKEMQFGVQFIKILYKWWWWVKC